MIEWCAPGQRPELQVQPRPPWAAMIEVYVHPVKVAALEALRWVGGPLSAREVWLLGIGDFEYGTVSFHVKSLADLGLLQHTASSSTRGSAEKFYVLSTT